MNKLTVILVLILFGFFTLSANRIFADEEKKALKNWEFELMPYFTLPIGGSGDVNINGILGEGGGGNLVDSIGVSNGDLDMIFHTRAEVWRKKIGFIFGGRYINADFDLNLFANNSLLMALGVPGPSIRSDTQAGILDFFFSYRLIDFKPFESFEGFRLQLEPYAGVRWDIFDIKLTAPNGRVLSGDVNTWAEVAFGANLEFWLTRGLSLAVRGDASGFGIGESSDLTWKATTLIGYRFPKIFGVYAGYELFNIEKDFISLGNSIEYDVFLHGPVLGLMFFY